MPRPFPAAAFVLALLLLASGASAGTVTLEAFLDGPSESPPNASPGTGYAKAVYDDAAHTLKLHVDFADLIGTTTVAHIHAPTAVAGTGTAEVATTTPSFTGFPVGVTGGTFDITLDLTDTGSFNGSFVTDNGGNAAGAEAALVAALTGGKAYLNIHTTVFPGGEIRAFFQPAVVPLPPAFPAGLAALALLGLRRLRRRRPGPPSRSTP